MGKSKTHKPFQTHLIKVHLLTITMFDEPVHVGLDERPCGSPDSCKSREEGKHVNIDRVDSIEDVLGPTTLLVSICEFANSDRDANTRELGFQRLDL